jgi:hypothetical protein
LGIAFSSDADVDTSVGTQARNLKVAMCTENLICVGARQKKQGFESYVEALRPGSILSDHACG